MKKNVNIFFRVVGILLLLLIVISVASFFLLKNPKIQTKLVQKYTTKLSKDLNTKIEIGSVDVSFFDAVTIKNIYVEDLNQDTLFYASKLHTNAILFQPFKKQYKLSNSKLENVKIRIRRSPGDSLTNLNQLLANFPSQEKSPKDKSNNKPIGLSFNDITIQGFDFLMRDSLTNKANDFRVKKLETEFKRFDIDKKQIRAKYLYASEPYISLVNTKERNNQQSKQAVFSLPEEWEIAVEKLALTNGQLINRGSPKVKGKEDKFAFNNFNWDPFTLIADDLTAKNDELNLQIEQLAFTDETGFKASEFQAATTINPDDIVLNELNIVLDKSIIAGDVTMNYRDFNNFSDFENKIRLNANINQVKLMPREFRLLFGSDILKESVNVSGNLEGKVNNLYTDNFSLVYENGATVKGNIHARGLPDLQNTFFDAKIDELSFTQNGLQQIMGKKPVPEQVKRLGNISFQGEFLGYISELVAYGDVDTDLGDITVDVKYTTDEYSQPVYSGYIETLTDFYLGYFIDNPDLGNINLTGSVAGKNFDVNTMQTRVDAQVSKLEYKGKTIENINVEGEIANQVLNASADINDSTLFVGLLNIHLDYSKPIATTELFAEVDKGDLYALGLMDSPFEVTGEFSAELTGNSVNELQGKIDAKEAFVKSDGKEYDLGQLGLEISMKDGEQSVALSSENASAEFIGNYNYTQLYPTVLKTLNTYYDFNQGWESLTNTVETNEEIGFRVEIKPGSELTRLILPDMKLSSAVNAEGLLNPFTDEISMLALADSLAYKNYSINNWQLDAFGDGETLYINSFQDDISNNNKKWLTDSELNVELSRNDILVDVRTYNDRFLSAKLSSRIIRDGEEFNISILSSDLVINEEKWTIQEGNSITLGGGAWEAENFALQNGEQQITIYNPQDAQATKLVAHLEKIELVDINDLIGFTNKPFEGRLSGDVNLIDYQDGLNLDLNLIVKDLLYNNDIVEVVSLDGLYNLDTKLGRFDGVANDDEFQFLIDSKLDLNRAEDILELNIDIVKSSLSPFENLWASSISDVEGYVKGNIQIVGGPKLFTLAGEVNIIEDVYTTLSFTQARYRVPAGQRLNIEPDGFILNNLKLYDPFGSQATINGKIIHSDLANFTLDLTGNYNNFLFLNTTSRDNEVFYGKAFASGSMRFSGPVNDAFMQVNASSEPNTQIFIQTPSAQNTGQYSFIRFRQPVVDSLEIQNEQENQSKLTMRFNLDINPNAEVNLRFDTEGYNTIRGNGYGDLQIDIDTENLLEINGIYEVNQGAYVVNFKDILEREFRLLPGGVVRWAEDPYSAGLNIEAEYKLQADVSPLTNNANRFLADATTIVHVDILGSISEPEFKYRIDVDRAQAGTEINENLRIINKDKTKLDNQIGSLLLLQQFSNINSDPFSNQGRVDEIAIRSVTNILTSQLSSLLSESGILENTQIGIDYENYRAQRDAGQLDDLGLDQSLQIQLSSRFFNDRIEVEYGGDFNFGDGLDNTVNTFQVGDFVFTYRLSDSGNYKFKLFSVNDFSIIQQKLRRRNGFGFIIKRDFDSLKELFEQEKENKEKENKEQEKKEELPPELQPAIDPNQEKQDDSGTD